MFDPSIPPPAKAKGTVPMAAFTQGKKAERARPKSRIVGKDQPRQPYRDLLTLSDGRVLVGYRGRFINSPFGLQVRAGQDLARVTELPDAAGPFCLHDGQLLTSGPLFGGYQSSVHHVDVATLTLRETFPVREPYLWLAGAAGRFVGQTPKFPAFKDRPLIAPALLDRHPGLLPHAEDRTTRLVVVEPDGTVSRTFDAAAVGPEYPEFKQVAQSPDGATLYATTERSVAALSLTSGSIRWRVQLGENDGPQFFAAYALALSPDGTQLAIAGIGNDLLVLLDAETGARIESGKAVRSAAGNTSIRALAWHPSGWLAAATSSARLIFLDPQGNVRIFTGAAQGIESLAFLDAGRSLLVCGAEKHFRIWPLLQDEIGG